MMRSLRPMAAGTLFLVGALALPDVAAAQLKPYSSGALSFNAPEMRKHGSGLYRPRRPHLHRGHFHRPQIPHGTYPHHIYR